MDRLNALLRRLEALPPSQWALRHPRLAAWIVLAGGMALLLILEARDVGLLPGQWVALLVASTLTAGACIWIISHEDEDEADAGQDKGTESAPAATAGD